MNVVIYYIYEQYNLGHVIKLKYNVNKYVNFILYIYRVDTQIGEWNSLTFPDVFKKIFYPSGINVLGGYN